MKKYTFLFLTTLLTAACNSGTQTTVRLSRQTADRIVAYMPAPGQFINEPQSGFENVSSAAEACAYAEKRLSQGHYVSLGAWGGYLVAQFDTPVPATNEYELWVTGNSFDGSSEPGIVWLMQDANGNGQPDDTWYELKGSEYLRSEQGYEITYRKPSDGGDVAWSDNRGGTGFVSRNDFHKQENYYPAWADTDQITFRGTLLPSNVTLENNIYVMSSYAWGYADNASQSDMEGGVNCFRIADAVTEDGQPANLTQVDFIKIHSGINDCRPGIGEISTEVCGIGCYRTVTVTE